MDINFASKSRHADLALKFLEYFCGAQLSKLEQLLIPDFKLRGPFNQYESAADYLAGLRENMPQKSDYDIVSLTESDDSVAVFYRYIKPDQTLLIAQLFKFDQSKIAEVLIIFDSIR